MPSAITTPQDIDATFTAPITRDVATSGWTIVRMPGSGEFFGTRKPVKVAGTIDGHPFAATLLPMGDSTHMVPIKAALRKTLGKEHGTDVTVAPQGGQTEIGFNLRGEEGDVKSPPTAFIVDDVDTVCDMLKAKQVEIIYGPTDEAWGGRGAVFKDPFGNELYITTA